MNIVKNLLPNFNAGLEANVPGTMFHSDVDVSALGLAQRENAILARSIRITSDFVKFDPQAEGITISDGASTGETYYLEPELFLDMPGLPPVSTNDVNAFSFNNLQYHFSEADAVKALTLVVGETPQIIDMVSPKNLIVGFLVQLSTDNNRIGGMTVRHTPIQDIATLTPAVITRSYSISANISNRNFFVMCQATVQTQTHSISNPVGTEVEIGFQTSARKQEYTAFPSYLVSPTTPSYGGKLQFEFTNIKAVITPILASFENIAALFR
jgi:hypothetical protein